MSEELVTVVIPVFNSADSLCELVRRLELSLSGKNFEVVFVDDRSTDNSWEVLLSLVESKGFIRAFRHEENYGQFAAIASGVGKARGDYIVVMDADLQDPPEMVRTIAARFFEENATGSKNEIVLCARVRQSSPAGRRLASWFIRRLVHPYNRFPRGKHYGSLSGMTRHVAQEYLQHPGRNSAYLLVLDSLDASFVVIPYDQQIRFSGESSYSFLRLVKVFLTAIFWNTGGSARGRGKQVRIAECFPRE